MAAKFQYSLAIDSIMMIMGVMLVVSATLNEYIYDSAETFKRDENGKLRANPKIMSMNVDNANKVSNAVTMLGSLALGMYALSLSQKKGKGSRGANELNKAPGITTTVVGFSVAVALIISGVIAHGTYEEIATFKESKESGAKKMKDASSTFIALGAIVPVLYTVKFAWDKGGSAARSVTGGSEFTKFFTY
jgi:hypothetical protein